MSEEKLSGAELVVRSLEYMNISTILAYLVEQYCLHMIRYMTVQ